MNGSRSQDNLITVDGAIATRTRANGTQIGVSDVDTIQEIQILTANFKAEYGRSGGGQIRMVTRSGTQDFHGTASSSRELSFSMSSRIPIFRPIFVAKRPKPTELLVVSTLDTSATRRARASRRCRAVPPGHNCPT